MNVLLHADLGSFSDADLCRAELFARGRSKNRDDEVSIKVKRRWSESSQSKGSCPHANDIPHSSAAIIVQGKDHGDTFR